MKKIVVLFACMLVGLFSLSAQEEVDTTIYSFADVMPRFPGCESLDTTLAYKEACAQASLLNFIYSNVQYPLEAQAAGISGTVVLNFIVETNGMISYLNVVNDIGGGCGIEALRVVGAMNGVGIRWVPGIKDGKPVRVSFNLPIRFKLEEPPNFEMAGRDSVFVVYDTAAVFTHGTDSLESYFAKRIDLSGSLEG